MIEVPENISEIFVNKQWGTFIDIIYPVYKGPVFLFNETIFNSIIRFEFVDFNNGNFNATGQNVGDEITAFVVGLSFHPVPNTVLKANYRRHWTVDAIGNPTIHKISEGLHEFVKRIKIELVVNNKIVDEVIDIIQMTAKTGNPGDGKIFVTDVSNVIKIRTNERGEEAI